MVKLIRRRFLALLSASSFFKNAFSPIARAADTPSSNLPFQRDHSSSTGDESPERFQIDYERFFRAHELTSEHLLINPTHGLIIGNGDVGAVLWEDYNSIYLSLSKNDVWDRRYGPDQSDYVVPNQDEFIEEVRKLSRGKTPSTSPHVVASAYPYPKTQIFLPSQKMDSVFYSQPYPSPKPCGALRFNFPRNSEPMRLKQTLSLYDAVLILNLQTDSSLANLRMFCSRQNNVIVISIRNMGQGGLNFLLDLCRDKDPVDPTLPPPIFGHHKRRGWIRHKFPPDPTYERGFEYVVSGLVVGADSKAETLDGYVRMSIFVSPQDEVQVYVALATTRDTPEPFLHAQRLLGNTSTNGKKALFSQHKAWWHKYWKEAFVHVNDEFIERLWYVQNYLLACCSLSGKTAPGLNGNWITMDSPAWHGDYHLNYNFQSTFWGAYSSNHMEQIGPYYAAIEDALPLARQIARETYGCDGVTYPLVLYPTKMYKSPSMGVPWARCMGITAWVAQGFWWHYVYTQDLEFLKRRAYPFMKECAAFYVDFLKKDSHDKYAVFPSVSSEHHGYTMDFFLNKNDTLSIALIKFLFRSIIQASEILAVDAEGRKVWHEILSHMGDYPRTQSRHGEVFADVENAPADMEYNVPGPIAMVFPGEDPDVLGDPALRSIAARTAISMETTSKDSFVMLPLAKMRLGLTTLEQFGRDFRHYILPNYAWTECPTKPDCGPMTDGIGMTAVINEALLQSFDGTIRVLPFDGRLLGGKKAAAAFANLRAVGAFLVSSEFDEGKVRYVVIKSLQGSECTLLNPWPGEKTRVRNFSRMQPKSFKERNDHLIFNTARGGVYIVDRENTPWESFRERTIKGQ